MTSHQSRSNPLTKARSERILLCVEALALAFPWCRLWKGCKHHRQGLHAGVLYVSG